MTPSRDELLSSLTKLREQLDTLLASLDEAQLVAPDLAGGWSVKDVLAHLTAWEVDLLTNLGKARRGQKPARRDWSTAAVNAQNEKWYAQYRQRPLESVLTDFEGVRQQTLRVVEQLTDAELGSRLKGFIDRPLADYIAEKVIEHETEHLDELRTWRTQKPHSGNLEGQVSANGSHGAA